MKKTLVLDLIKGNNMQDLAYQQQGFIWHCYLKQRQELMQTINQELSQDSIISEANWLIRQKYCDCQQLGIKVHAGDVCYIDYGQAYLNEVGYQHFGLIMSICQRKALVIPMTSNQKQYLTAYDDLENPKGKHHLMRLDKLQGMSKTSVLFLNDCRYINTARVIDVKAHLKTNSILYLKIKKRLYECLETNE